MLRPWKDNHLKIPEIRPWQKQGDDYGHHHDYYDNDYDYDDYGHHHDYYDYDYGYDYDHDDDYGHQIFDHGE